MFSQSHNSTGCRKKSSRKKDGKKKREGLEVYNAQGKVVGVVVGSELRKVIFGSRHFLKQPPGIANDEAILRKAEELGAREVVVLDRETNRVYRAKIETIQKRGIHFDRGWGAQVCLPFPFWNAPPDAEQMPLAI